MIAQEEILKEPRDTMSQNIPSPRSRGAPIPEEGNNTHGLRDPLDRKKKGKRRKANILLLKNPEKLMDMERKA
nr:hypothetical protein CFP56_15109 [Quercus suber]